MKLLCQTCTNIFDFPECCTEDLEDSVKIITNCRNYRGIGNYNNKELWQEQELKNNNGFNRMV